MKELDAETTDLLVTIHKEWKKYGCGGPDVFWLGGTLEEARVWRETHKLEGGLAVIPAGARTLAPWNVSGARNTIVAIGMNRIRAVVTDATSATLSDALKRSIAETMSPEAVMVRLAAEDEVTRRDAIFDVRGLDKKDAALLVPRLVAMLHDEGEAIRSGAAGALGAIRDEHDRAIPALTSRLLQEDSPKVREQIVRAISGTTRCRAAKALPALVRGLEDEVEAVRFAAAAGIGRLYGRSRRSGD